MAKEEDKEKIDYDAIIRPSEPIRNFQDIAKKTAHLALLGRNSTRTLLKDASGDSNNNNDSNDNANDDDDDDNSEAALARKRGDEIKETRGRMKGLRVGRGGLAKGERVECSHFLISPR